MAPWRRLVRSLLLAIGLACIAVWAVMLFRLFSGSPGRQDSMFWLTGTLMAGWACMFAYRALDVPPDRNE